MESRRPRKICHCPRSRRPFSSTLLFLSWILPTSSFAQLTSSLPPTSSPTPTTTVTSTIPSSFSSPSSSNPPPTPTQPSPAPAAATSTNASTTNDSGKVAFNYYFVIIAAFVVLFCLCIVWFGRRKKRKAAIRRHQSQRALARDVEGWRTRFRANYNNGRVEEREDGLDERGEAPPPYAPGSKPPSIRSHERRSTDNGIGEEVELQRTSAGNNPPEYHEAARSGTEEDIGDITRPRTAVTASERFGSMRRLLSPTEGSSEA